VRADRPALAIFFEHPTFEPNCHRRRRPLRLFAPSLAAARAAPRARGRRGRSEPHPFEPRAAAPPPSSRAVVQNRRFFGNARSSEVGSSALRRRSLRARTRRRRPFDNARSSEFGSSALGAASSFASRANTTPRPKQRHFADNSIGWHLATNLFYQHARLV
jgi:hypothetical protein